MNVFYIDCRTVSQQVNTKQGLVVFFSLTLHSRWCLTTCWLSNVNRVADWEHPPTYFSTIPTENSYKWSSKRVDLKLSSLSSHYSCGWKSGLISLLLGIAVRSRSLPPHLQDTEDGNVIHQKSNSLFPVFIIWFLHSFKRSLAEQGNKPYSCIQNTYVNSHC